MRLANLLALLALAAPTATAADTRIAVIDKSDVEELIRTRVLAKPENAEAKKTILEIEKRYRDFQVGFSQKMNDPATKDQAMKEFKDLNQEKVEAEKQVDLQIQGELIRVVKKLAAGKYPVVLDANSYKDAIVAKDAEVIDITLDVKEALLTQ